MLAGGTTAADQKNLAARVRENVCPCCSLSKNIDGLLIKILTLHTQENGKVSQTLLLGKLTENGKALAMARALLKEAFHPQDGICGAFTLHML